MNTGCNPPYVHGTGGWCGCNCGCCLPKCCPVVAVYFDCGAPQSETNPEGCVFTPPMMAAWSDIKVPLPAPIPEFSKKPIISDDRKYIFGAGVSNCSVPCQTVCVEVRCGGFGLPCCCLEILNGQIVAVGNGYVTAPSVVELPACMNATILINGLPPPVFVHDGDLIVVTLITENDCCSCEQVDVKCAPCPVNPTFSFAVRNKPLFKRKTDARTGKTKINPKSGLPIFGYDKNELIRRILARIKYSRRRKD